MIKYPRTVHLPFSPGATNDDKIICNMDSFVGKEIVITEKMDGECLPHSSRITLATGKTKTIGVLVNTNKIGEYVLGVNELGQIVPSKITNVYKNGNTTDWMRIKVKGLHGAYQSIICTPSHEIFLSTGTTVPANNIRIGDTISMIDSTMELTEFQKQVLLGKILGDGSIAIPKTSKCGDDQRAGIQFSQKIDHVEYVQWTNTLLGDLYSGMCVDTSARYGNTRMVKSWTKFTTPIYNYFNRLVEGKKCVPDWVVDDFSLISLAFWYMDDGSLSHWHKQQDRAQFSVCGFDKQSCVVLQQCLMKFDISSSLKEYNGYRYLILNYKNINKLAELIHSYVPTIMEYKLPQNYRNGEKFKYSKETNGVHNRLRTVRVIGIDDTVSTIYTQKYDIETETHNYFANGVLVHNCTTILSNGKTHARSVDSRSHESRNWLKQFAASIAHNIPTGWRICGENLYAQHSLPYNNLSSYFYGFSVWDDKNNCLDWNDTIYLFENVGVIAVPVLYRGPFKIQTIIDVVSDLDLTHQEGVVVRITEGFLFEQFNNVVAKWVRNNHVQTDEHWMNKSVIPNKLRAIK